MSAMARVSPPALLSLVPRADPQPSHGASQTLLPRPRHGRLASRHRPTASPTSPPTSSLPHSSVTRAPRPSTPRRRLCPHLVGSTQVVPRVIRRNKRLQQLARRAPPTVLLSRLSATALSLPLPSWPSSSEISIVKACSNLGLRHHRHLLLDIVTAFLKLTETMGHDSQDDVRSFHRLAYTPAFVFMHFSRPNICTEGSSGHVIAYIWLTIVHPQSRKLQPHRRSQ